MKKKVRKLLKKNFIQLKNAFSLVEIAVSLLVIAIIIAALTPTISKRLSATSGVKNRITSNCTPYFPDGYCAMCYISPVKCITCTKTCPADNYKNTDKCICESCATKYNDPQCDRCNSKGCTRCAQGYYMVNGKCTICPPGSKCYQTKNPITGKEESVIEQCQPGEVQPNKGQTTCIKCKPSTATQIGTVQSQKGQTACINCTNGNYAAKEGATSCTTCPAGSFCSGGKKDLCPLGTANNKTGQIACTKCLQSNSSTTGTVATNTGMTACTVCGNGYYASAVGQTTACNSCNPGYYCPQGKHIPCSKGYANGSYNQTACKACVKSTSTVGGTVQIYTGQSSCIACGNGQYASTAAQQTNCNTCPAGYACPNGKLVQCAIGQYAPAGQSSCRACGSGQTSSAGSSSCVNCAVNCSSCYNTGANCTACKVGYYKSGSNCVKCPVGKRCPGGTSGPIACASNQTSTGGTNTCINCDSRCATCNQSATNCPTCKAGSYKNGTGCTTCPQNYYCVGGTTGAQHCGTNRGTSSTGATSASQCYDLWKCTTYGGTVKGSYCYKMTSVGGCSGTVAGHTWKPATAAQVGAIGISSVNSVTYGYCAGSRYSAGSTCIKSCSIIRYRAGYTSSGYSSRYTYYPGGYNPASGIAATAYSGCTGNVQLCVTNN